MSIFIQSEQKQRLNNRNDCSATSVQIRQKILFNLLKIKSTTFKFKLEI